MLSKAGLLAGLPSAFSYTEAKKVGLSDRRIYALRDVGAIEQIGRGLFRHPGIAADPDLQEIAHRATDATLCLGTALARHGLSDEIPAVIDIALPRNRRLPRVTPPVRWHRFDANTFSVGHDTVAVDRDLTIGIYNPERSICDAFRLRHLAGDEQAIDALKRWLRRPEAQPSQLLRMARRFGPRAETPIREALRILL
jgi:predicted transcriptional regulator of viral defense system